MKINIGNKTIGLDNPPYFIADIAANHDGKLERAYKLIELAKESGADAAKFQNFTANKIVSDIGFKEHVGQVSHQKGWSKSVYEIYQDASLSPEWTPLLKAKCDQVGIEYMTSPYDFQNVELADPYVNAYKIGSGDITWTEMLSYIARKGKPVLLATGASTMEDVQVAVNAIPKNQLVLMQCNTNYTGSLENFNHINLSVLTSYAKQFPGVILGLSDHTPGCSTVLGGIALGARVIEKHFTDNQQGEGPDHGFSMTPTTFSGMVSSSLELYKSLGDGIKKIEENERLTAIIQRRCLYLTRTLEQGSIIAEADLEPLRPALENGFIPREMHTVVGKTSKCQLLKGTPLLREHLL